MGRAKQCDICGGFYTPYNMKKDSKNVNGFMFVNIDCDQQYFEHTAVDCCPECMSKIQKYIEEMKEER